jgi:hypothetical protein
MAMKREMIGVPLTPRTVEITRPKIREKAFLSIWAMGRK